MSSETAVRPIVANERVSDVLARDESLVELFVRLGPQFLRLRNRAMRRVMARLVTVEQAARIAGVSAADLLRDLNTAIGSAPDKLSNGRAASVERGEVQVDSGGVDPESAGADTRYLHPLDARVVEVDVRDDLRAGREPFSRIMEAISTLAPCEVLHLRTTFETLPLYTVLGKRGFMHEAQAHADDDWSAWFWRADGDRDTADIIQVSAGAAAAPGESALQESSTGESDPAERLPTSLRQNEILLDVRGLEPPEPLVRTLAALELLPEGHTLVQINARVPQFLLPMLAERGFACEVNEGGAGRVLLRIWRAK